MKKLAPLICMAALGLSACSSDPNAQSTLAQVKAFTKSVFPGKQAAGGPTPEEALIATLQATKGPVAAIAVEAQGVALPFVESATNGPVRTWINGANQTISIRGGMIVATRGYGHDLMANDSPEIVSLLTNRKSGAQNREMYFIDGSDTNVRYVIPCTVAPSGQEAVQTLSGPVTTTKMVENCTSGAFEIENTFWVTGSGVTIQSRQWVSVGIGYVVVSQVRG